MALKVKSIDELDPALVEAAQAELSQLIQERHPEVELTRGVIHDIVAFFAGGVSGAINQTEVNRVLQSRSLLAIQANPQLADPELVDHVLSNFLTSRRGGTRARGAITIVVTGDATVVISGNSSYFANGLEYVVDAPITARPPGTVTSNLNDRVLQPRGNDTYEFSVPATAAETGEGANARAGTKFTPDPPPARFVTAFSDGDFIGGTSAETNAELVKRMEAGIPAKVTAGRSNILALVKAQPQFAEIKNLSIIGYGDEEMTRDQHWIFPVSGGGRLDIYAQNDATPRTIVLRKVCRLVELRSTSAVWQCEIDRDDAPGFYGIAAIRRVNDPTDIAGFEVIQDQRGWYIDPTDWSPDLVYPTEAIYTRYQTSSVKFIDDATSVAGLAVGATQDYLVSVTTQPLIREMQEFLTDGSRRHLSADIVVKSAVPCFLSINCDIVKNSDESAPSLNPIKIAIANRVNNLNFPGELYASQVADVIHDYLIPGQAVGPIDMHGRIQKVDGETLVIRDKQVLRIPHAPSVLVTPKTTAFVLYPENVGLNVINRGV
jgi:hypothetical protein